MNADAFDELGMGYPRPQMRRADWISLNGPWEFEVDPAGERGLAEVSFGSKITVPFAPETERSGIADTGLYRRCWYRRAFKAPPLAPRERLFVRFGAVDFHARVWLNGGLLGEHEGGYTPFSFDVTRHLVDEGPQVLVVRADDDPGDLQKPRGKQDWLREPHSIWYPRTTGVWQTVWLERVPPTHIENLAWTPNLTRWEIGLGADLVGPLEAGLRLEVELTCRGQVLARDSYDALSNEIHRRIALSDPGIDDFRNELLWSPRTPTLIDARVRLVSAEGETVDEVASYTALRSVALERDLFVLNGRPYYLRLALDQGYWPSSGATAPDDAALSRDVELAKEMGFNGVRKHQKIEDPRYLYWADRLGLLVWEEMPSAYRFSRLAVERVTREWLDVLRRDYSHPCVVAWVPINESWGVPNLPADPGERHYVEALFHLTKSLDRTRPVVGNDGWESVATDIIGVHDYDSDPVRIKRRYHGDRILPHLLKQERPGGRLLVVGDRPHIEHPLLLSEFGGIKLSPDVAAWGYSSVRTSEELAARYEKLLESVRSIGIFAGFCYTQFADTYQEANGLLYADRKPKFPIDRMRAATIGPPDETPVWAS